MNGFFNLKSKIKNQKSSRIKGQNSRRAATLTEVLIAIFVMGIGMLSLLALFPLGLQNMASAIQDNRLATVGSTAQATAEYRDLRSDPYVVGVNANAENFQPIVTPPNAPAPNGSLYDVLSNPPFFTQPAGPWLFNPDGPTPPVLVDPLGVYAYGTAAPPPGPYTYPFPPPLAVLPRLAVSTNPPVVNIGVPRTTVSFVELPLPSTMLTNIARARNWLGVVDDLNFTPFGVADSSIGVVERDRKFTWAYVWRRPRFNDPKSVELTVVFYKSRRLVLGGGAPPSDQFYVGPAAEGYAVFRPYSASQDPNTPPLPGVAKVAQRPRTAIVTWNPAAGRPAVKRGDWIFDATVTLGAAGSPLPAGYTPPPEFPPPYYNGYFYRVVGISDPVVNGAGLMQQELELDRPVRNVGFVAVVLANVADVIEKSNGQMDQR